MEWLTLQTRQADLTIGGRYGQSLKDGGPCFSAFVGMDVIASAGVVRYWDGRALAWSLLSTNFPAYKKTVSKAIKQFLAGYRCRRLEITVDPRHDAAKRWAKWLGFEYESTMRKYTPLGDTQEMWVRLE